VEALHPGLEGEVAAVACLRPLVEEEGVVVSHPLVVVVAVGEVGVCPHPLMVVEVAASLEDGKAVTNWKYQRPVMMN